MGNLTQIMKSDTDDIRNDQKHSFSIVSIGFYTFLITIPETENHHMILGFKVFSMWVMDKHMYPVILDRFRNQSFLWVRPLYLVIVNMLWLWVMYTSQKCQRSHFKFKFQRWKSVTDVKITINFKWWPNVSDILERTTVSHSFRNWS